MKKKHSPDLNRTRGHVEHLRESNSLIGGGECRAGVRLVQHLELCGISPLSLLLDGRLLRRCGRDGRRGDGASLYMHWCRSTAVGRGRAWVVHARHVFEDVAQCHLILLHVRVCARVVLGVRQILPRVRCGRRAGVGVDGVVGRGLDILRLLHPPVSGWWRGAKAPGFWLRVVD